jgi:hypothetical protein
MSARPVCGGLRDTRDGIAFNEHFEGDGRIVFEHACALGCEGIVSGLGSPYRAGRVDHWLKDQEPGGAGGATRGGGGLGLQTMGTRTTKASRQSMSVSNEQSSRTGDQR